MRRRIEDFREARAEEDLFRFRRPPLGAKKLRQARIIVRVSSVVSAAVGGGDGVIFSLRASSTRSGVASDPRAA